MSTNARLAIIGLILTLFGGVLILRLFFIQIVSGNYYASLAERQQIASEELSPRRGKIFIRDKEGMPITVATTRIGYVLYADVRKLTDPEKIYEGLSGVLEKEGVILSRDHFFSAAQKKDDPFEILVGRIEEDTARRISEKEYAGIGLLPNEWRYYPLDSFASHVLGFFGFGADGKEAGQYGVERFYDKALTGSKGFLEGITSSGGIFLNIGERLFRPPAEGKDIILTIEFDVQKALEGELDRIGEAWHPFRSGGIIIDPVDGRIIAMAARNDFNPNYYGKADYIGDFLNPLISSLYELGSVFKPLTIAAALDAGAITPQSSYFDSGYVQIADRRIENFDGKGRGTTDIQGILNESLNTGAVFVGQQLGKEKFLDYFERYGLDTKTDIDLPSEAPGDISSLGAMRDVEYATATFGQGIAVTPIEFVRAVSALANGGFLVHPYIVENGIAQDKKEPRRILSAETSETITKMLVTVVDEALLGGGQAPKHFSVAAKTGTAQIANVGTIGYSGKFLHAFFGYAPAFDPKFLIFLFAEDPKGVLYASHSLGPSFLDLTEALLYYYEIPPNR